VKKAVFDGRKSAVFAYVPDDHPETLQYIVDFRVLTVAWAQVSSLMELSPVFSAKTFDLKENLKGFPKVSRWEH